MAMFYCQECDRLLDGDWVECEEWGDDLICLDCHVELVPENWEDWKTDYDPTRPKKMEWSITHKDYDGAPIDSLGPPGDHRYFLGPSLNDVWEQAKEYEEENDQL